MDIELRRRRARERYAREKLDPTLLKERKRVAAEWRANNPHYRKNWNKTDKAKLQQARDIDALHFRKYGITKEQTKQLAEQQGNKCAICNEIFPGRYCIDHCHTTNVVRGILCSRCNCGLGQFRDNIHYLESAINYLKQLK